MHTGSSAAAAAILASPAKTDGAVSPPWPFDSIAAWIHRPGTLREYAIALLCVVATIVGKTKMSSGDALARNGSSA